MDLNKFIDEFNINNPQWNKMPQDFFKMDANDLGGDRIGKYNAIKTIYELHLLNSPKNNSHKFHLNSPKTDAYIPDIEKTRRQSAGNRPYRYSPLYRNGVILQLMVKKFTEGLEYRKYERYVKQIDSAVRSVVANIREGYLRPSTREFLDFLGYAHASMEEVRGDIEDARDDKLLRSIKGSSLESIGIRLRRSPVLEGGDRRSLGEGEENLGENRRSLGEDRSSLGGDRRMGGADGFLEEIKMEVMKVRREDLTCEMFIELINKTDWLFKKVVEGLHKRIIEEDRRKRGGY